MTKQKPKESPEPDSCENCLFWREKTEAGDEVRWGLCHRLPPQIVSGADGEVDSVIAWTHLPFWCGELKQRTH